MTRTRETKQAKAMRYVEEQRAWMREHGWSRAGYIARYGSVNDPEHYGAGGEAIYAADREALDRLEEAAGL